MRPVLEHLVTDVSEANWDRAPIDGECTAGQQYEMKRTIAVGSIAPAGFATLKLTGKSVHVDYGKAADSCWRGQTSRPQTKTVREVSDVSISYRDGAYQVPQALTVMPKAPGPYVYVTE